MKIPYIKTFFASILGLAALVVGATHVWANYSNSFSLSESNITLRTGQNETIYLDNENQYSSHYISSNLSNGIVAASLSGTALNITGQNPGSTTVTVCGSNDGCASVYVSVNGYNNNYSNNNYSNSISLSTTTADLAVGSSVSVTAYSGNGNNYYGNTFSVSSSNPSVATASSSGNTIVIYGNNPGSASIQVCNGACSTIYVSVTGSYYNAPTPYYPPTYNTSTYYPTYYPTTSPSYYPYDYSNQYPYAYSISYNNTDNGWSGSNSHSSWHRW